MDVTVYSTGCPQCNILMRKLMDKGIAFTEITDENLMAKLGITSVPVLLVDGERMEFSKAIAWVNGAESQGGAACKLK